MKRKKTNRDSQIAVSFDIESECCTNITAVIAGADEAGRGALAGPLAVGLVVYPRELFSHPPEELLHLVRDSKKLTHKGRIRALACIQIHALCVSTCLVSHRIVDRLNVNGATEYALRRLVAGLSICPDLVLMDGNFRLQVGVPVKSVVGGDGLSLSIASASIAAKVRRDSIMERLDVRYPGYGFSQHKGYGTAFHRHRIVEMGPSPVHRRTYEPVKSMHCPTLF
ncbi:MAG TPA: ribonuclease HII [Spirochaetota bacterium]|nr:ribonuclease HII [Spirochaetota bacterium]